MRDIVCDRDGCILAPKMTKTTQVGRGVIQDSQSYLVPLKSTKSGTVGKKKRRSQVGKGKRRSKSNISITPTPGSKGQKRKCVKSKSKKSTCKNLKKSSRKSKK